MSRLQIYSCNFVLWRNLARCNLDYFDICLKKIPVVKIGDTIEAESEIGNP